MPYEPTDEEAERLITEPKFIRQGHWLKLSAAPVWDDDGDCEEKAEASGQEGRKFIVWTNRSIHVPNEFCVGLRLVTGEKGDLRLTRFCGPREQEHTNKLEPRRSPLRVVVNCHHIHIYRLAYLRKKGCQCDSFAQPTDSFSSFDEALEAFRVRCNLSGPDFEKPLFPIRPTIGG